MKFKIKILISYLFLILLMFGCTNPYEVRKVPFLEPTFPMSDETLIYVFREDTSYGGARKFPIICNDTVLGVLTPGTFCTFKVKSGENEIVAYMSPSPIMHYRVQNRAGETVYLYCNFGYTTGTFMEEIDKHKADELMQEFKYTEIGVKNHKAKMNYKFYYDNLYK
jgi:hypothetical protein